MIFGFDALLHLVRLSVVSVERHTRFNVFNAHDVMWSSILGSWGELAESYCQARQDDDQRKGIVQRSVGLPPDLLLTLHLDLPPKFLRTTSHSSEPPLLLELGPRATCIARDIEMT